MAPAPRLDRPGRHKHRSAEIVANSVNFGDSKFQNQTAPAPSYAADPDKRRTYEWYVIENISFLQLRLDERRDRAAFGFTWLSGRSFGRVEGVEQTIYLR